MNLQLIVLLALCFLITEIRFARAEIRHPVQCKGFKDTRTTANNAKEEKFGKTIEILKIPAYLTSDNKTELQFYLSAWDDANGRKHEDLCKIKRRILHFNFTLMPSKSRPNGEVPSAEEIIFEEGSNQTESEIIPSSTPSTMHEPYNILTGNETTLPPNYFTPDGYVHANGHFYSPEEYCVQEISDSAISLKACAVDCSADLSSTSFYTKNSGYTSSRICIPKCCAIDEVFSSEDLTCRKLDASEPFHFFPYLYLPSPIWFRNEDKHYVLADLNEILSKTRLARFNGSLPQSTEKQDNLIIPLLHFYKNIKLGNACSGNKNKITIEKFNYDYVKLQKKKPNRNFRLEVSPGHVMPTYLTRSRKWIPFEGEFCVDGEAPLGRYQVKNPISQVVVLCSPSGGEDSETRTNSSVMTPDSNYMHALIFDWFYAIFAIFSCFVMLSAYFIYFSLRRKLNLQGLVVMSHCLSVLLFYSFFTLGELVYLGKYKENSENPGRVVDGDGSEDTKRIGTFCSIVSFLAHYFQLAVYFWLTAMNCTLWKLVPIPVIRWSAASKDMAKPHGNRRLAYLIYSGISWGLPLLLVIVFLVWDVQHANPFLDSVVPDYGVESCHVASWSLGYYVHLPIFILLGINLLCIFTRFVHYLKRTSCEDTARATKNKPPPEYFSSKLFMSVFFIQAISWSLTIPSWYQAIWNAYLPHWSELIIVFSFASLIVEPLLLLHFYCLNECLMERITEKYPVLLGIANLLRRYQLLWENAGLVGDCCGEVDQQPADDVDDTVVIESADNES